MDSNKLNILSGVNEIISNGNYLLNAKNTCSTVKILANSFADITLENTSDYNLTILVENDAKVKLGIINQTNGKNVQIAVKIKQNAEFSFNFADFSIGKNNIKFCGDIDGEFASINCHIATITNNNDDKVFDINLIHNVKNTNGKVESYGVSKGNGKLTFAGTSYIKNGSVKSSTTQIAKAMIFDKESIAIAKPVLRIDENDVVASHAAAVGKINDEHIFYLTSRGLTVEEARQIITLGYLKPIINEFDGEYKDKIDKLIEGNL